jgi:hypothetical protein
MMRNTLSQLWFWEAERFQLSSLLDPGGCWTFLNSKANMLLAQYTIHNFLPVIKQWIESSDMSCCISNTTGLSLEWSNHQWSVHIKRNRLPLNAHQQNMENIMRLLHILYLEALMESENRIWGHIDDSKLQAHSHEFGGHAKRKTNADLHLVTTVNKIPSSLEVAQVCEMH